MSTAPIQTETERVKKENTVTIFLRKQAFKKKINFLQWRHRISPYLAVSSRIRLFLADLADSLNFFIS